MRVTAFALLLVLLTAPCSANGVNTRALAHLVERARATHSNGLVVIKDGRVIESDDFGTRDTPLLDMSITKSFCALAVLRLISDGKLSLSDPMAQFVPEWTSDPRGSVTLDQVLSMTTGLADPFAKFISPADDIEGTLRNSPLRAVPGSTWRYNNNAINLVNIAVRAVTNQNVDAYLHYALFAPLGIENYRWLRDKSGHPACAFGLALSAPDLAKVGEVRSRLSLRRCT